MIQQIIGRVSSSGEGTGSGFTASRESTGVYKVTFVGAAFTDTPAIVATPVTEEAYACTVSVFDVSYLGFTLNMQNLSKDFVDYGFSFIAVALSQR